VNRLALILGACLALAGCGPRYQTITFELNSQPPIPVRVDADEIELPVGVAVSIRAQLQSSSSIEFTTDDALELKSKDRDVLLSEDTAGAHNFVLVGVKEGETCLSVVVEYEEEDCIPVRVLAAAE
jgi:hypothetical protein